MILLDTQAFIWLVTGELRLGSKSRKIVEEARDQGGVFVAAITPWEISMLTEKKRLGFEMDVAQWIVATLESSGICIASLDPITAVDAGRLPGHIHGDPADRIIIATARNLACPLLTTDRAILDYGKAGHVHVIDARL